MRTKSPSKGKGNANPANGIDAVRNLIFGEQIAEYDLRFSNMELALMGKLEELETKINLYDKKLSKLDSLVKKVSKTSNTLVENKIDKDELADTFKMLAQIVADKS